MAIELYLAFDGDHCGNTIKEAALADKPNELRVIDDRIKKGNEIFKNWAESIRANVISLGGDEGRFQYSAEHTTEIKSLVENYKQLTRFTVSVGIGTKLSEAEKALMYAKLHGKNQIIIYSKDIDKELHKELKAELKEQEEISLEKAYKKFDFAHMLDYLANPSNLTEERPEIDQYGDAIDSTELENLKNKSIENEGTRRMEENAKNTNNPEELEKIASDPTTTSWALNHVVNNLNVNHRALTLVALHPATKSNTLENILNHSQTNWMTINAALGHKNLTPELKEKAYLHPKNINRSQEEGRTKEITGWEKELDREIQGIVPVDKIGIVPSQKERVLKDITPEFFDSPQETKPTRPISTSYFGRYPEPKPVAVPLSSKTVSGTITVPKIDPKELRAIDQRKLHQTNSSPVSASKIKVLGAAAGLSHIYKDENYAPINHENQFHMYVNQSEKDQTIKLKEMKKEVAQILTTIKAKSEQLEQLKQTNPDAYDTIIALTNAILTLARELNDPMPEEIAKSLLVLEGGLFWEGIGELSKDLKLTDPGSFDTREKPYKEKPSKDLFLVHLGQTPGKKVLTPENAEMQLDGFTGNHIMFYKEGALADPNVVNNAKTRYATTMDSNKIYDLGFDRHNFNTKAAERFVQEGGKRRYTNIITDMIQKAGYHGYENSTNKVHPGAVAVFSSKPVLEIPHTNNQQIQVHKDFKNKLLNGEGLVTVNKLNDQA